MSNVGKPSPTKLQALLKSSFGKPSNKLIVGPGPGLDAAILDIGNQQIMAIAEDPIFPAPNLPLELMGWFTVHIGASDVAVTGIKPQYMTYTLLMPPESTKKEAAQIIGAISEAAAELEISIVGGHTGWYAAVTVPTVGGVTVWGTAPENRWISPGGAKDGDLILMTKGPSIEAAALLAVLYRDKLTGKINDETLNQLCARTNQITVVEDALIAFRTGGVHAMHDATEGGVLGGLWEMNAASGLPVTVDLDAVTVPDDILQLAKHLQFDPWQAISEGTLLAAVESDQVSAVMKAWEEAGIPSYILGRFDKGAPHNTLKRDGKEQPIPEPEIDPFWNLFFAGLSE